MRFILRRLYRGRRRYAIVFALLFATGFTLFWGYSYGSSKIPVPLVGGLVVMLGVGMFVPPLCLIFPSFRFVTEIIAVSVFLFCIVGLALPESALALTMAYESGPSTGYFLLTILVLQQFFYGTWSDKWLTVKSAPIRSKGRTRLPATRLWDGFYPTPGKMHLGHEENLVSLEYLNEGEPHLREVVWMPPGALLEEIAMVEELEVGKYVRSRWEAVHGKGLRGTVGVSEVRVDDHGKFRRIRTVHDVQNRPWREVLINWIDDTHGQFLDDNLAKLEKRVATGEENIPVPQS